MKTIVFTTSFLLLICSCQTKETNNRTTNTTSTDSLALLEMIKVREKAMKEKDMKTVMSQFRDDATFINSNGFYFKNKKEIESFHKKLTLNDTVGYTYKAGIATIRILSPDFALAYYPWEMDWYKLPTLKDTINWYKLSAQKDTIKEIGLMSLTAQKDNTGWKWKAITNQHTEEYFNDLKTHVNQKMIE